HELAVASAPTLRYLRWIRARVINQNDLARYVRQLFQIESRQLNGQQRRILESCFRLFEEGKGAELPGVRGTLWGAYNAVTEYLAYERRKGQDTRLAPLWFGEGARTHHRALAAALAVAGRGGGGEGRGPCGCAGTRPRFWLRSRLPPTSLPVPRRQGKQPAGRVPPLTARITSDKPVSGCPARERSCPARPGIPADPIC